MQERDRVIGIDILKIIAVILVLAVHFFLNTQYYDTPRIGRNMRIQSMIRDFCLMCVPLFITITGYLNNEKEYNKSFFKKLLNILIVFIFYSVVEIFVLNIVKHTSGELSIKHLFYSIFSFNACRYSWYINMYIGLYLISPFINNTFERFDKKNRSIAFILSIVTFVLPNFINNVYNSAISIPYWWTGVYPIAYYILGKYIKLEKPKFNKKYLILILLFNQLIVYSYNLSFWDIDYNIFPIYLSTALVFLLFYDIQIKKNFIKKILVYISTISLDIYLASSLIDQLIYPLYSKIFNFSQLNQQQIIFYAPIVLITGFLLSALYGTIRKKLINVR